MNYRNINSMTMKEMNAQSVVNAVRNFGQISRRDLAAHIGLTTATITNLVNELIEKELLLETGSGASAGGRKPILLEINPYAGYIIGIELNTAELICILSNFKAEILEKVFINIDVKTGKDYIINQIIETVNAVIEKNGLDRNKVLGIGFVSAGPYERDTGVMINPPNFPGWHYVPIRQIIENATGIKTYFEKETPAAALGEYWFGKTNGNKRILFTNVYEVGLGGGMVINGDVFHGFRDGSYHNIFNWNFVITDQKKRVKLIKDIYGVTVSQRSDYAYGAAASLWENMQARVIASKSKDVLAKVKKKLDADAKLPEKPEPTPSTSPTTPPASSVSQQFRKYTSEDRALYEKAKSECNALLSIGSTSTLKNANIKLKSDIAKLCKIFSVSKPNWRVNYEKDSNQIYVNFN